MTTFKNNARYAELLLTYLDTAAKEDSPITIPDVLRAFPWKFKGGSLQMASESTRLKPVVSPTVFPDGLSGSIADSWPYGADSQALWAVLVNRARDGKSRIRAYYARLATLLLFLHPLEFTAKTPVVYTGMRSIYHFFGLIWSWAPTVRPGGEWETLKEFTREMLVGTAAVSMMHLESVDSARRRYVEMVESSRVFGLWSAIRSVKALIRGISGGAARKMSRLGGQSIREALDSGQDYLSLEPVYMSMALGPMRVRYTQGAVCLGLGDVRFGLGLSDLERLHQLLMSTASAVVGVCAQASVGTPLQRAKSRRAVGVCEANVSRIVASAKLVPLGDEVLVCKGYRRAHSAYLGVLAGPLCARETLDLVREAEQTAGPGVLDVQGYIADLRSLDAASGLNASKVFKICPAPDVSPGASMIDRILQIGNGNTCDEKSLDELRVELRSQILRAYIRSRRGKIPLRNPQNRPAWHHDYVSGHYDKVPTSAIHDFLEWEGDATMPDISPNDPSNWKDSGLGADTIWESQGPSYLREKSNMMSRLIFDDDCPMPGTRRLNPEHVIKFFMKAEGHKDPARGIFSANLTDRQAQSWMEKAVQEVAVHHPSYMIGQNTNVKAAKVVQLTTAPTVGRMVPLFYSFDISGWSAKMPGNVQRMSHDIWAELYGEELFRKSHQLNEGAHIYVNLDGYKGWFKNTGANLEGFNGKEMTMVLVALLSLSVRKWRDRVVQLGLMTAAESQQISSILFAYIDDGLSRIDLPKDRARVLFEEFKQMVNHTFGMCGFTVELTKCYPSDRFAIFLNEIYLAGRHVVHGVRAAMAISSEPTEKHTTLVERTGSVSTGCRGAVMAGLSPAAAVMLMAYHTSLHLEEWVSERDPVMLAIWCLMPRAWGGLGMPNMLQMYTSGSGSAFEEAVGTMQAYARHNRAVSRAFVELCKIPLMDRTAMSVLVAPLSGRHIDGYMVDSRVPTAVRRALQDLMGDGRLSRYAMRLLKYSHTENLRVYAEAIVPLNMRETLQEQMLIDLAESHPSVIFSTFARRLEKAMTVTSIIGRDRFRKIMDENRSEAVMSVLRLRKLISTA